MADPTRSDNVRKPTPHDGTYRRLFSHARMVEDLICRYVTPPWLDRLDFSTLEQAELWSIVVYEFQAAILSSRTPSTNLTPVMTSARSL